MLRASKKNKTSKSQISNPKCQIPDADMTTKFLIRDKDMGLKIYEICFYHKSKVVSIHKGNGSVSREDLFMSGLKGFQVGGMESHCSKRPLHHLQKEKKKKSSTFACDGSSDNVFL